MQTIIDHVAHERLIEHGLVDGCDRCREIANDPFFTLDDANLQEIVRRTRDWMNDQGTGPRSDNERDAMSKIELFLTQIRHLRNCGVDLKL